MTWLTMVVMMNFRLDAKQFVGRIAGGPIAFLVNLLGVDGQSLMSRTK